MKNRNIYLLMIIEAILIALLFFSEGALTFVTVGLFFILELVILTSLLSRKFRNIEMYGTTSLICSLIYIILYLLGQSTIIYILGIGIIVLLVISAMLLYEPIPRKLPELAKPSRPAMQETYDFDKFEKEIDNELLQMEKPAQPDVSEIRTIPEKQPMPQRKTTQETTLSKAMAYELEREAGELQRAESYVRRKEAQAQNIEIEREAAELNKAEAYIKDRNAQSQDKELQREAAELVKAQSYLEKQKRQDKDEIVRESDILKKADAYLRRKDRTIRKKELSKEAKQLEVAESDIKNLEFLNKQQKAVGEAKAIVKVQKQIDKLAKDTKKAVENRSKEQKKTFVATKTGNRFHEPGCLTLKKVQKNKLVAFNSKKDAIKKGYQPCNVCKP